jgi:GTPase SAR1 family protein
LNQVETWIDEIKDNCHDEVSITVIGNKMDLADREIQEEDVIEKLGLICNNYQYVEVSAETGDNISENAFLPMI